MSESRKLGKHCKEVIDADGKTKVVMKSKRDYKKKDQKEDNTVIEGYHEEAFSQLREH